jgi:hypothetical protein
MFDVNELFALAHLKIGNGQKGNSFTIKSGGGVYYKSLF